MKKKLKKLIKRFTSPPPVVPVVRLEGVIAGSSRYQEALNLRSIGDELTKAFEMDRATVVAIVISSPGGSPTHSALVHDRIRHLAEKNKKEVLVFVEEIAASGGYFIACAGDKIYGLPSSVIGSIGVISASFGLDKLIEKLGVARRVQTSGECKGFMDPFLPENPNDVERLSCLQKQLHEQFIKHVKSRRSGAINGEDSDLFSGEFWLGQAAKDYGLVDEIGDLYSVLEERFGKDVQLSVLEKSKSWIREMLGFGARTQSPHNWVSALEYRTVWASNLARFGL